MIETEIKFIHIPENNFQCSYCGESIMHNETKYLLQNNDGTTEIRYLECLEKNLK
jgi:aerobic-type carbon monoxide dehydrogenase small subunit (CoxS/CutS family)